MAAILVSINPALIFMLMVSFKACFILSDDHLFQEVGAETKIEYHKDFNYYKQLIQANFESPGMATTFKRLNFEVLGHSLSSDDPTVDDHDSDSHDSEEDQMRAELWGEPGLSLTSLPLMPLTPFCCIYRKLD